MSIADWRVAGLQRGSALLVAKRGPISRATVPAGASGSADTARRGCSVRRDHPLTSVNCPNSLIPRAKKSLQPRRYFMYRS